MDIAPDDQRVQLVFCRHDRCLSVAATLDLEQEITDWYLARGFVVENRVQFTPEGNYAS
jgi:hypothetical protein